MLISFLRCGLPLALLVMLVESRAAEPQAREPLAERVDQLLAKWKGTDSPGCSVAIIHRGQVVYQQAVGSANLEHHAPNTALTVFETASFSKTFTCACLAMLMDEGKLAPEDDIRKFVPEMHAFEPPIRVQDLVRCKSGLWDQVSVPYLIGWENAPEQTPYRQEDYLSLLLGQRTLPFEPGTEFRYSSGDYFLLGVIVQRLTGQTLAKYAEKRIFRPLGMTRTFFEVDPTLVVDQRAIGHHKLGGSEWHLWRPTGHWVGGGGLKTCVEDLVRWDRNFREPSGKYLDELLRDGTLLGNRYCLDVDAYSKETNPDARRERASQYRGLRRNQFTGGAWGFTTAMSQFPDQQFTAICLSNSDEIVAWQMNRRFADLYLGEELKPVDASSGRPASDLPTFEVTESQLSQWVGAYRLRGSGAIWQIVLQDGSLRLIDHLLAATPLRCVAADRFDPEATKFYATTTFTFSPATADGPARFTSQWDEPDNRGSLVFEAVKLVEPESAELEQYAGEYVSDELAATYRLEVREGQLWLRVNSRRWEQLDATVRDEFIPHLREPIDGRIITFLRDDKDAVSGLAVEYYRVKGVRFSKREQGKKERHSM